MLIATMAVAQFFCATSQATAAVIAADNFNSYTPGSILDQGTIGDGWESAYTGLVSERDYATPLRDVASGGMAGFGQSLELGHTDVSTRPSNNNIVQRLFTPQTDTLYVGLAFKMTGFDTEGVGTYFLGDFFQLYVNNTSNTEGWTGSQGDSLSTGVDVNPDEGSGAFTRKCGDQTLSSTLPTNDTVHRMVMKVSKSFPGFTAYDQVALFVDQETEGTPDAARDENETTTPTFDTVSVLHVRIWGMELDDRVFLDELRIATTYADALPELPILEPVPGDTNDDRIVDDVDAKVLAGRWGQTGLTGGYSVGDFNADGAVDARDAAILAAQWGNHMGGESAAAVPEPGTIVLLLGMALAALPRRSRG